MATQTQVFALYQLFKEITAYSGDIERAEMLMLQKLTDDFSAKMYEYQPIPDNFSLLYKNFLECDELAEQCFEVFKRLAGRLRKANLKGSVEESLQACDMARDLLVKLEIAKVIFSSDNSQMILSIGSAGNNEQIAPKFIQGQVSLGKKPIILNVDPKFTTDRSLLFDDVAVNFYKGCLNLPSDHETSLRVHSFMMEALNMRLNSDPSFQLVVISSFSQSLADIAIEIARNHSDKIRNQLEIIGNHGGISTIVRYNAAFFRTSGYQPLTRNSGTYYHNLSDLPLDLLQRTGSNMHPSLGGLRSNREFLQMTKEAEMEVVQGGSDREIFLNLRIKFPLARDELRFYAIAVAEIVRETGFGFQSDRFSIFFDEVHERSLQVQTRIEYLQKEFELISLSDTRLSFKSNVPDPFLAMVKPLYKPIAPGA